MDFYGLSYTPLDRPFGSQAQRPDPKARGTVFQPASVDEFDEFRAEIYTKKMGKLIKLINIISYTTVVDDYLVSMIYIYTWYTMWETQSSSYHLGMVFVSPIKKSDVGMVYEWVYQIIYSVMVIIHESIILILLSYLYISGIIMLDDHNPWKKNLSSQFLKGRQKDLLWRTYGISLRFHWIIYRNQTPYRTIAGQSYPGNQWKPCD